ncbi:hypothetical protein BHE74_00020724 [Ensete ventricosum]|nr:hypothetical protein GW17_00010044 [Ensete ventricosum]RWW71529.1 hypothetical protein BHE74_00020724 [Ensete ventricosum]RZR99422.1 hypothetical protein BHM03_00028964 [Ensete ventricosum]
MSGSTIHPRLSEVIGGWQSITGSKHNSFYYLWQNFTLSHKHQSTKGYVYNEIGMNPKYIRNNVTCMRLYEII